MYWGIGWGLGMVQVLTLKSSHILDIDLNYIPSPLF